MRGSFLVIICLFAFAACGGDEEKAKAPAQKKPVAEEPAEEELAVCESFHEERVAVNPRFEAGQKRRVTITKRREQNGTENEATSTATLEALGPRRLRWTSDDVGLPEGIPMPENLRKRLVEETEGLVMEYAVHRDGRYDRLINVEEVRASLERVLDLVLESAGNDAKLRKAVEASRKLVLSDDFIQASVTQEISMLHGGYGLRLKEGKPLKGSQLLPNPFGGRPIPAKANAEFTGIDQLGCVELSIRVTPHEKAFARAVEKGLGGLAGKSVDLPDARLTNIVEFSYDAGTGWMTRAESLKDIVVGGQSRTDHVILDLAKG